MKKRQAEEGEIDREKLEKPVCWEEGRRWWALGGRNGMRSRCFSSLSQFYPALEVVSFLRRKCMMFYNLLRHSCFHYPRLLTGEYVLSVVGGGLFSGRLLVT